MNSYQQHIKITQWAEEDRPREKLMAKGRLALTNAELIAILIGSGTTSESAVQVSQRILALVNNRLDSLGRLTVSELTKVNGIGPAKAISIVAAIELGRRRADETPEEKPIIRSANQVFKLMRPRFQDLDQEHFWVIMLNNANRIIHIEQLSHGGVSATLVDTRLLFKKILEHLATGFIIAHNHPSGCVKPSSEDLHVTKKIKKAANLLDVTLLDHLIFANNNYYSFADQELI